MTFEWRQDGEDLEVGLGLPVRVLVTGEHTAQRPRPGLGEPEDGKEEEIVADHVQKLAAAHDAARRRDVAGAGLPRRIHASERAHRPPAEPRQALKPACAAANATIPPPAHRRTCAAARPAPRDARAGRESVAANGSLHATPYGDVSAAGPVAVRAHPSAQR